MDVGKASDAALDHISYYRQMVASARRSIELWKLVDPTMTEALDDIDKALTLTPAEISAWATIESLPTEVKAQLLARIDNDEA